ncbi:hypothetical protein GCM10010378_45540 [Streptomyces viridochromogenes]
MHWQGDVLIVAVAQGAVPEHVVHALKGRRDGRGRLVPALGEVTGRAHAVVGPGELVREGRCAQVARPGRGARRTVRR